MYSTGREGICLAFITKVGEHLLFAWRLSEEARAFAICYLPGVYRSRREVAVASLNWRFGDRPDTHRETKILSQGDRAKACGGLHRVQANSVPRYLTSSAVLSVCIRLGVGS